jgi:hypothetical protein
VLPGYNQKDLKYFTGYLESLNPGYYGRGYGDIWGQSYKTFFLCPDAVTI